MLSNRKRQLSNQVDFSGFNVVSLTKNSMSSHLCVYPFFRNFRFIHKSGTESRFVESLRSYSDAHPNLPGPIWGRMIRYGSLQVPTFQHGPCPIRDPCNGACCHSPTLIGCAAIFSVRTLATIWLEIALQQANLHFYRAIWLNGGGVCAI